MGMFGIKPAMNAGHMPCDCSACEELRRVTLGQRAAAAGYVVAGLLSTGIVAVVGLAIVWVIVKLAHQL